MTEGMRRQGPMGIPGPPLHLLLLLCLGPVFTFSKVTTAVTIESKQNLNSEEFIQLANVAGTVSDSEVSVHYLCAKPCIVNFVIVASSEFRTAIPVFKKRWKNENHLHVRRTKKVNLKFPDIMAYRNDYFIKHSIDIRAVWIQAWIVDKAIGDHHVKVNGSFPHAALKAFALLSSDPPFQRPFKDHKRCLAWNVEHRWRLEAKRIHQCPCEDDVIQILNFPYASSGGNYGIIKKFQRFKNRELEGKRQQLMEYPMFTFSIWLYLLHYCSDPLCGIIHHIDPNNMYSTPLLFLTRDGYVHIQMQLVSGSDFAVKTNYKLPLNRWFRLDFAFNGKELTIKAIPGDNVGLRYHQAYSFKDDIYHNDISGYCVLGGSKYVSAIEGFFGPIKYYRLRFLETSQIDNPLSGKEIADHIASYYRRYSSVQEIVYLYVNILQLAKVSEEDSSLNFYSDLDRRYGEKRVCLGFPWGTEVTKKYKNLFKLLRNIDWNAVAVPENRRDITREVGQQIFKSVLQKISKPNGLEHLNHSIPSLVDSSYCGYHKASHFLSVIYETGLTLPVDTIQGLLYSLVGAQGDERLALMKLGYKHYTGNDGYQLDLDLSYGYYSNIGSKTTHDQHTFQGDQAYVETVRIMEDETLKDQTKENGDVFLFLKHEAGHGDVGAQHRLAQMFFWGQQGIAKNAQAAVEWYEKGALENEDPIVMYDYAIVLFRGQGVPRNRRLALQLMQKAAAQGLHQAVNGLGWYYHSLKKNYTKAVKYWTKADRMGNVDSVYNLGAMYLDGIHPRHPGKNETLAFQHIHRAAKGGHIEGALLTSHYLMTGKLNDVPRDPETAIQWAKFVAEQNGYLGYDLRKALDAYIEKSWHEALLHYLLTAEVGVEMSQTNLAYICEERPELAERYLSVNCVWRYYNLSVFQDNPPSFAYLKMGDLYYYGLHNQSKDLDMAIKMYTEAATLKDSQGFFNLALLLEEGIVLPDNILEYLKINKTAHPNNVSLLLELYERCRSLSSEESISPCSFAVFYFYVKVAWGYIAHFPLVYIICSLLSAVLVAIAIKYFQSVPGAASSSTPQSSQVRSPSAETGSDISSTAEGVITASDERVQSIEAGRSPAPQQDLLLEMVSSIKRTLRRHRPACEFVAAMLGIFFCLRYMASLLHHF